MAIIWGDDSYDLSDGVLRLRRRHRVPDDSLRGESASRATLAAAYFWLGLLTIPAVLVITRVLADGWLELP